MRADIDTSGWNDIVVDVSKLADVMEESQLRKALKEIGNCIMKYVKQYAPSPSDESHTHIKNDIKMHVKKSKQSKELYVSVLGGRDTGYKWNFINKGFTDRKGKFHEGNHFVDRAERASESEVNDIIDKYIKSALGEGKQ